MPLSGWSLCKFFTKTCNVSKTHAECSLYVAVRLVIRLAENLVARPKHRRLRRKMASARSYKEWYTAAQKLDRSQGRDEWLQQQSTALAAEPRYNWGLVHELLKDLQDVQDPLVAIAILQQCTRKNVGGIMSPDLFSYSNSGEPKTIVTAFCLQVTRTIRWVTDHALRQAKDSQTQEDHRQRLQQEVRQERDKLWKSLIDNTVHMLDPNVNSTPSEVVQKSVSRRSIRLNGSATIDRQELLAFLKRARAAYGRTALCLSGKIRDNKCVDCVTDSFVHVAP